LDRFGIPRDFGPRGMLDLVIANGWLTLDRSGTFVKFAPSGA
jgi:hypothetical protein